jgi:hypothetical protein
LSSVGGVSRSSRRTRRASVANFLTAAARSAVDARLGHKEHHQLLKEDRPWADLLSSMPLCFNLFTW